MRIVSFVEVCVVDTKLSFHLNFDGRFLIIGDPSYTIPSSEVTKYESYVGSVFLKLK